MDPPMRPHKFLQYLTAAQMVCHSPGGKGFCLGDRGFRSGQHEFNFFIAKEKKGYEGTCVGVSIGNPKNFSHRLGRRAIFRAHCLIMGRFAEVLFVVVHRNYNVILEFSILPSICSW